MESRSSDEVNRRVLRSSRRSLLAADSPSRATSTQETSLSSPGDSTSDAVSSHQESEEEGDGSSGDLATAQPIATSTTTAGEDSSQEPMQECESLLEAGKLTLLMQDLQTGKEGAGGGAQGVGETAEPAESAKSAGGGLLEVPSSADVWADSDPSRVTMLRRHRQRPRLLQNVPSPARRVLRLPSGSSPDSPLTGAVQEVQGPASTSHSDSTGDSKGGDHLLPETESSREAGEVRGLMAELQASLLEGQAHTEDAAVASHVVADVFQAALSEMSPDTGGHSVESRSSGEVNRRVLQSSRRSLLAADSPSRATSTPETSLSPQGGSTSDAVSSHQESEEEGDGSSGDLATARPTTSSTTTAGEDSSQEPMQECESLLKAGNLTLLMQELQTGKEGAGGGAQGVGETAEPVESAGCGLLEVPSYADIWADSDPRRVTVVRQHRQRPRLLPNVPSPARRVLRLPSASSPDSPLTGAVQEVQGPASTSHSDSTGDSEGGDHLLPETESSREPGEVRGLMAELQASLLEGQAHTEDAAVASHVVADVFQAALSEISPDTGTRAAGASESPVQQQQVEGAGEMEERAALASSVQSEVSLAGEGQQQGGGAEGGGAELAEEPGEGEQQGGGAEGGGAELVEEPGEGQQQEGGAEGGGAELVEEPGEGEQQEGGAERGGAELAEEPWEGEHQGGGAEGGGAELVEEPGEGQQQGGGAEGGGAELAEEPGEGDQQGRRRKRRGAQAQTYKAGWKKRGRK